VPLFLVVVPRLLMSASLSSGRVHLKAAAGTSQKQEKPAKRV